MYKVGSLQSRSDQGPDGFFSLSLAEPATKASPSVSISPIPEDLSRPLVIICGLF